MICPHYTTFGARTGRRAAYRVQMWAVALTTSAFRAMLAAYVRGRYV